MPDIDVPNAPQTLRAYFNKPAGEGPWPGVVVVFDVWGQSDDSRAQVDWLAHAGYLAVAPDLYSSGKMPFCVVATIRSMVKRSGPAFDAIEAARALLADRADCTGNVGIIGFCMGGGFALLAAKDRGFAACSVNYGRVPSDAQELLEGACPVIGSFGGLDKPLKGASQHLEAACEANGIAHDVKEYPEAGHGFMNHHEGRLGWVLSKLGIAFEENAAADSRARILAFFRQHLAGT